jgi:hypothetical protein
MGAATFAGAFSAGASDLASVKGSRALCARTKAAATFPDRIAGAMCGLAIGDGMGGPVEGWRPDEIKAKFSTHDFATFLPAIAPKTPGGVSGKGDGRITDDTLLVEALMRIYEAHRDHLDAYAYASLIVPELSERKVFVPERGEERTLLARPVWWPERYVYHRLAINNAPPREAGLGNWPNQGLAGIVMPTGAVNAGDPDGAYHETVAFGLAHQTAQGLESAAVTAAGFAAAFASQAAIESVLAVSRRLAKDGTGSAIEAVLAAVDPADDRDRFIARVRKAYLPYSGLIPGATDDPNADPADRTKADFAQPSRTAAVENLPVALACLAYAGGDAMRTLEAAIFYGQDCESIAAHALGLVGALHGAAALPQSLLAASAKANRRDFVGQGRAFAKVCREIAAKDAARLAARTAAMK